VLGALLVTCSIVGLITAHRAATAPQLERWLVATSDIPAGTRIEADDLGITQLDLGDVVSRGAFGDPDEVIGRVALGSIRKGEILQRGTVGEPEVQAGSARRVSVSLPRARALDGALAAGARVDVLATTGEPGTTTVITREALVVSTGEGTDGLGSTGEVTVSLVVADETAATSIVDASVHGTLTLISPTRLDE
jgi:Flp pilus assembly protein CpaB